MSLDNPNGIESSVSKNSKQRRTFLKRATAGAVIASIPGRSAWAGIGGSIAASGHGSDFNQGASTNLLDASAFNTSTFRSIEFSTTFGGNPINRNGNARAGGKKSGDLTFGHIFDAHFNTGDSNQLNNHRGVNRVNIGLIVLYLNAVNHNKDSRIVYNVLSQHDSVGAFADYLYAAALDDPHGVGTLLNNTVSSYSP
jgi:hypothetical protein